MLEDLSHHLFEVSGCSHGCLSQALEALVEALAVALD
jgi:hypothetical protein